MKNKLPLWGYDYCVKDGVLWFVHGVLNVLIGCNLTNGKIEKVRKIPVERKMGIGFTCICNYNNLLYLMPCNGAEAIVEYNICDDNFVIYNWGLYGYRKAFVIQDVIYGIPTDGLSFSKVSLGKLCYEKIEPSFKNINQDNVSIINAVVIESKIVCVVNKSSIIIIWDTVNDKFEIKEIGEGNYSFRSIASINNRVYLADSQNGNVIVVDSDQYIICDVIQLVNRSCVYTMFSMDSQLLCAELCEYKHVLIIFQENGRVISQELLESITSDLQNNFFYTYVVCDVENERDIIVNGSNNKLIIWKRGRKEREIEIELTDDDILNISNCSYLEKEVLRENELLDLNWFIRHSINN